MLLTDLHLNYAQIAILNAIFWTGVIFAEIPTGMLADGRGRGWSLLMGSLVSISGGVLYLFSQSLATAIIAEIAIAISSAFFSGASTAWVIDAPDRTASIAQVHARTTIVSGIGTIGGVLIGVGFVPLIGFRFAFLGFTVFSVLNALFVWRFMQEPEREHPLSEFESLKESWHHLRKSPSLRWVTGVQILFGAVAIFNLYWSPLALTTVTVAQLAWLWIPMYGSMIVAGTIMHRIGKLRAVGSVLITSIILTFLPLMFAQVNGSVPLLLGIFLGHEISRGLVGPLIGTFVDERVRASFRATFQSISSFAFSTGMVTTLGVLAFVLHENDPDPELIVHIWRIVPAIVMVCAVLLWKYRPR